MKYLFETSFEVCNKVGGIYTVVGSKAKVAKESFDKYFLIGPYFEHSNNEFVEEKIPEEFAQAFQNLYDKGVAVKYGTWIIEGRPKVLLLSYQTLFSQADHWKGMFWEKFGVDSLNAQYDFTEPLILSIAAGMVIEELSHTTDAHCISHAHEWMCGFTNLYLKTINSCVATVFTTHATMLGRSICGNGQDLYQMLERMNPMQKAKELGVIEKHTAEVACATYSDVFTTVSELTGVEAKYVFRKDPDVIVHNGLDFDSFPSEEKLPVVQLQAREQLNTFLKYFFFPYHYFDLDKTTLFYTSGRHEVRNKGIDIAIRALGKVNEKLRGTPRTIVFFIMVPYRQFGISRTVLTNKIAFNHLQKFISQSYEEFSKQVLTNVLQNKESTYSTQIIQTAQKFAEKFRIQANAPYSPFYIDSDNEIIELCKKNGLYNAKNDAVKIVYYPSYLNGYDNLIDLPYYKAIAGCDLGIFPSYYEPWGYTPLESVAMGIPTITTDLAGFGLFAQDLPSINVLKRRNQNDFTVVEQLAQQMSNPIPSKIAARQSAQKADWDKSYIKYKQAYALALKKRGLL